jgi:hypothetical protein
VLAERLNRCLGEVDSAAALLRLRLAQEQATTTLVVVSQCQVRGSENARGPELASKLTDSTVLEKLFSEKWCRP